MSKPIFMLKANGVDVTDKVQGSGITMTITEGTGKKSDTLQIVIDDIDGSVASIKTGAILNPIGGYEGELRDFGQFSVDSVTYSGWPQQISIDAKSVSAKSLAKQRDPKSYPVKEYPTYGHIFAEVASRVGLTLKISASIKGIENEFEAQTEENGLEFLMRIGEDLNASVTVKANHLVVVEEGEGLNVSGEEMGLIKVAKGFNILKYSITEKDEPKHSKVEASYYDRKKNKKETVTEDTGSDGPTFCIRAPRKSKASAKRAAKAQAKRLKRAERECSFDINGSPFAQAGAMALVSGCRPNVDGRWHIKTATHQFSASGPYTTSLSCTAPSDNKGSSYGKNDPVRSPATDAPNDGIPVPTPRPNYEAGAPSLTGDGSTNIA
ncbi:phage late control D family protein [Pseudochrobactrum asaccharolyticum]|uniref:Phage protein D n=1 Tax=Pseudochrobactrum asaccharolyticum TaxID=354351 RepID=A0A366DKG6_9HYPH|nr:late control protein D [Pseudochrobactrum asaccharolyticum]RBO90526.1 phage protein D [Pseudochrobactrum asaccharolyticum]